LPPLGKKRECLGLLGNWIVRFKGEIPFFERTPDNNNISCCAHLKSQIDAILLNLFHLLRPYPFLFMKCRAILLLFERPYSIKIANLIASWFLLSLQHYGLVFQRNGLVRLAFLLRFLFGCEGTATRPRESITDAVWQWLNGVRLNCGSRSCVGRGLGGF
jgi:hypothetical protein